MNFTRITQHQGRITTEVRGSHVNVTVGLRGWWVAFLNYTPSQKRLESLAEALCLFFAAFKALIGIGFGLTVLYLMFEVGSAFLPGGAVDRVLHGWPK